MHELWSESQISVICHLNFIRLWLLRGSGALWDLGCEGDEGQDRAEASVSEEPRARFSAFDLASADWAGACLPLDTASPVASTHAPLAYLCASVSRGWSAGSALRNRAAPPRTPRHPSPRNNYIHVPRAGTGSTRLCTDTNESRSASAPKTHTRCNSPAGFICVNRSLPELCSQPASQHLHFPFVFSGLKLQLPSSSLCTSPTLSLAIVVPVSVILSPFWHVALQKMAC